MEETSERSVDINLEFYQTRSNAIILHETIPAYGIPKVVRDGKLVKSNTTRTVPTCERNLD